MTDLERLRDKLPPGRRGIIDAHLKEDAEYRDRIHKAASDQAERASKAEAELAKLRERLEAQGKRWDEADYENARLREENRLLRNAGFCEPNDDELAKLREDRDLGKRMYDDLELERDDLLAALRGCLEWFEANPVNETGQYHERQARAAIAEVDEVEGEK